MSSVGSSAANHEIEVKLRYESVEPLRRAGLQLVLEQPRHFEDNWLLDDDDASLGAKLAILRVRSIAGGGGTLTYKGKAEATSQFKARVEIETPLADPASALAILAELGYRKWFRYQKYRTVYRALLPKGGELQVMFDETPLGNFIELEGAEEALTTAVSLLGVQREDYILASYLALQMAFCRARGCGLEDMVFEEQQ
jgi:adenylate cyclase class 2